MVDFGFGQVGEAGVCTGARKAKRIWVGNRIENIFFQIWIGKLQCCNVAGAAGGGRELCAGWWPGSGNSSGHLSSSLFGSQLRSVLVKALKRLQLTHQEEEGIFEFSISISPKNLSCILDANDILPAIYKIAVQATNSTDMQVGWVHLDKHHFQLDCY